MEVILCEDIPSVGNISDVVKVKAGYARNYLLPRGLAIAADKMNRRKLDHQKRVAVEKRDRAVAAATAISAKVATLRVVLKVRTGEAGKLFGSVTNADVEKALSTVGVILDRKQIRIEESIRQVGEYTISIHYGAGVIGQLRLAIESET